MLPTKVPGDPYPYDKLAESRPFDVSLPTGVYVYVQDGQGTVWIAEDGVHRHPKVLGKAQPAAAAGELVVDDGVVVEVDNVSGTFQFGPETIPQVIEALRRQGGTVAADAARPFRWEN
ncbi:MAG: hypothetical protein WD894_13285 [Pirellulales bacterium]